jgi:hypothetical protein
MTRHHLATALAGVALLGFVGCGDNNDAPAGATGEEGAQATEEQVTTSFEQWRYKRASRVGDSDTQISVDNVSCEIESAGEATCYERVVYNSLVLGKFVENNAWDVEYEEATGELFYAEQLGNKSSDTASQDPAEVQS